MCWWLWNRAPLGGGMRRQFSVLCCLAMLFLLLLLLLPHLVPLLIFGFFISSSVWHMILGSLEKVFKFPVWVCRIFVMMSALKSKQTHTNVVGFSGSYMIAQNPGVLDIAHSFTIVPQVAGRCHLLCRRRADNKSPDSMSINKIRAFNIRH